MPFNREIFLELPKDNPEIEPPMLDIVKIDGRWAQSVGGVINYLDDGTSMRIDWNDYKMVRFFNSLSVRSLKDFGGETFTQAEIDRIHWASDMGENTQLREEVRVYAEYTKNPTNA